MFRKTVACVLVVAFILTSVFLSGGTEVLAAGAITNDTANKVLTATGGNMSMQFNYNGKLTVESLKLGGTVETIEANEVSCSALMWNPVSISASYTYSKDSLNSLNNGVISYSDSPRDRWTSYSSGGTSDWVVYDFGGSKTVTSVKLYLYSDGGGVKAPASYNVQYWNGSAWADCAGQSKSPSAPAGNAVNTDTFSPVSTQKLRVLFTHQTGSYSGATEIEAYNGSDNLSTGGWKGTDRLNSSPVVSVNGSTATFSGISYTTGNCTVTETWTVTAGDSSINLQVNRTYDSAATFPDQKSISLCFKKQAFDVVQRTEDGGSFILLDPNRNINRFLSNEATANYSTGSYYNNDKYSFYSANMDLLDKLNGKMLSIGLTSNRNRATKIWRPTDRTGTRALKIENKLNSGAFSFPSGTYLPLKVFQTENFNPVTVAAGQTDTATYTFSCANNLNKYYDLGSIPAGSGLDEYKLAQYMQDFGRASVIDGSVGMGDCDLSGIGTYETWWYGVNALGLQGGGNEKYLQTLKNFVTFIKDHNYPIYNNGHIYARTYREMTGWEGDNFMDGQAQFVAGIAQIFDLSGDTAWLNSIKDMARSVLNWTLARDTDGDGLVEAANNYNTDNRSSDWNDCVSAAHENAYANVMLYKALTDWADIEEFVLLDSARATNYRNKAALLKASYNKDTSNGGFWSPATNSFVYWRDKDGSVHGDVRYVFTNAYPVLFGMVDGQRAQQIMNRYTDFMATNNLSLFPTQTSSFASDEMWVWNNWKHFENGGIFLQHTYDMMGAYAKLGDREKLLSMLKTATNLYSVNNLWSTGYLNWDLTTGTQVWTEPWMTSGVRPASGFYSFIMGIQPKYDRIIIDPCADSSLNGISVNYKLRGHDFAVTLNDQNTRNITTDGSIPVDCQWSNLPMNVKYVITDQNLTSGATVYSYCDSGTVGRAGYTFNSPGQHKLTIAEDANCTNLAANTAGSGYPSPSASYTYPGDNVWWAVDTIVGTDSTRPRSRWTSYNSGNSSDWYAVDFGTSREVAQAAVNFYSDGGGVKAPAGYNLQYWDGGTWVDCANQSRYPAVPGAGENHVTFSPVNTQKLRIVMTHQSGSYSGMNEFRVYSPYTVNHALNTAGSGNPTPSASYTSSGDSVWSAADGDWTDGNYPRTRWTSYGSGNGSDWYAVNFGSVRSISEIRPCFFDDGKGVAVPAGYNVQYWNGSSWVDCADQAKYPAAPVKGNNKATFTPVNTTQIRILMTHQPGKYSGMTELRAYK